MNITSKQIDALKEMFNIGVGHSIALLNTMLGSHIILQVPFVKVLSPGELKREIEALNGDRLATVVMSFKGSLSGTVELIFPAESAAKLVTILTGKDTEMPDLDSVRAGTLCEIGNIILNGVMGTISNILQFNLSYSIPNYMERCIDSLSVLSGTDSDSTILLARTRFTVEKFEMEGDIVLLFKTGTFAKLLTAIDSFSADIMG